MNEVVDGGVRAPFSTAAVSFITTVVLKMATETRISRRDIKNPKGIEA
jgi:hypothetical protein